MYPEGWGREACLDRASPRVQLDILIEALPFAVFCLAPGQRLLSASRRARALVEQGRVVRLARGRLVAADPEDDANLDRALKVVLAERDAAPPVRLGGGRGRPELFGCLLAADDTQATLVLASPCDTGSPRSLMLAAWFALTPTEARLAAMLAQGKSPQQAARMLGITLGTARTHLKSLFRKTHTSRQAELVRVLNMLPVNAVAETVAVREAA